MSGDLFFFVSERDGARSCGAASGQERWDGLPWQIIIEMAKFVLLWYVIKDDVRLIKDDAASSGACGPELS